MNLATPLAAPAAPQPHADPLDALPGIDARIGRATLLNNDTLYRRLLVRFRDNQAAFTHDYRAALAAADVALATRLAHDLRTVSGSLGARRVQDAAESLELATECLEPGAAPGVAIGLLLDAVEAALRPVLAGLAGLAAPASPGR